MTTPDEAIEAALFKVESIHHIHGDQCLCGFKSSVSRDRTKHIMEVTLKAASPHIAAPAWDEGRESVDFDSCGINPYRRQE